MTIEEKIKTLVNQICNEAVIYNGNPDRDVFTQAILALMKPMSRERLTEIIQKKHIYVDGVCDTDCYVVVPLQSLADAILKEWEKGA